MVGVAKKPDSHDICFITDGDTQGFLAKHLGEQPGPVVDADGAVLGEHRGHHGFTVGQRQGLGIGGVKAKGAQKGGSEHQPWFVARKDLDKNILWVVQGHDHPWLLAHTLQAGDASWVAGHPPAPGAQLAAKTRYRQADAPCVVQEGEGNTFSLKFSEAQWAVTPGQSAVLYVGDVCLGGGIIL